MAKTKTNKSAAKRFKTTGSGKIMRRKHMRAHLLVKKSSDRKRRLAEPAEVTGKHKQKVMRLLGKR